MSLSISFISFGQESPETVTDIDGNIYTTITKRKQVWMVENLKTTRFNDGRAIPKVVQNRELSEVTHPAYYWLEDDETKNKYIGALYNWHAVETRKLCPIGWHVPSDRVYLNVAPDPIGSRSVKGSYSYDPSTYYYWTSTECSIHQAYCQIVEWKGAHVTKDYAFKNQFLYVRCIKD